MRSRRRRGIPVAELARLQESFAKALVSGARAGPCVAALEGPADRAAARLAVYRGNSVANAHGALAMVYPVIAKIVGSGFFEGLAREYWHVHPCASGDLNRCGEGFPDFVGGFRHTQDLPYLADVARMEWLAHLAYYAADPLPLDDRAFAAVSGAAQDALWAIIAPACAVLESAWPIARLWEIHQDDYSGELEVDWKGGGERILVSRPLFHPCVTALSPGEFHFMNSVLRRRPIAAALQAALSAEPAFDLTARLPQWIAQRVIVGMEAPSAEAAAGPNATN